MPRTARKSAKPAPVVVTEDELIQLMAQQRMLKELTKQLKGLAKQVEGREEALINKLRAGAVLDSRTMTAIVKLEDGACRPAWKEEYLDHMLREHNIPTDLAEEAVRARTTVPQHYTLTIGVKPPTT